MSRQATKAAAVKDDKQRSTTAASSPSLLIGTPAYGGMMHMSHVQCLFELAAAGISFRLATIGNESLITRARNTILSAFHSQPELSHLLFLDADVHLPAADLKRMLAADVPVIGAPVALKALDPHGNRLWNLGRSMGSAGALVKVEHVGTAALLLSRQACNALVDDAIANGRIYRRQNRAQGAADPQLHYDVFQVGVRDGVYFSEDYWACARLRSLGFDILIDPAALTTHHGTMAV